MRPILLVLSTLIVFLSCAAEDNENLEERGEWRWEFVNESFSQAVTLSCVDANPCFETARLLPAHSYPGPGESLTVFTHDLFIGWRREPVMDFWKDGFMRFHLYDDSTWCVLYGEC